MKRSTDEAATWSKPERLYNGLFGPLKNKPVLLADGSILSPTNVEIPSPKGRCGRVHFERSTNGGRSWEYIGPVNDGTRIQVIQPSILFNPNNRLQALGRTQQCRLFDIRSKDGGLTWGRMSLMDLPNNNCGTDAVTQRDGRQELVYHHPRGRVSVRPRRPHRPLSPGATLLFRGSSNWSSAARRHRRSSTRTLS